MRAVKEEREQPADAPRATKGLRIATRCVTVDQFVETYHQVCEDNAIFIPNTQRPVDTVMQFRFDLQDGNAALLGVGTVVEELTTKHNRFNHVGIVVALQRLSPTSAATFDQMLARAKRKLVAKVPVYPRAMTVPVEILPIPAVPPPASVAPARSKTIIGLPAIPKKLETVRIPAIIAPPAPKPAAPKAVTAVPMSIDDGWDSIANKVDDAAPPTEPVVTAIAVTAVTEAARTKVSVPSHVVPAKVESTSVTEASASDVGVAASALDIVTAVARTEVDATSPTAAPDVATAIVHDKVKATPLDVPVKSRSSSLGVPATKVKPIAEKATSSLDVPATTAKAVAPAKIDSTSITPASALDIVTAVAPTKIDSTAITQASALDIVTAVAPTTVTPASALDSSVHSKLEATSLTEASSLDLSNGCVTTVAAVEPDDSHDIDVSDGGVTTVADELAKPGNESFEAVTVVDRPRARATEPDPFESVTAVENPDTFLLALMRNDGRAAPVSIEVAAPLPPPPITFPVAGFTVALDQPVPVASPRRRWRWVAAACAFAVLLVAIAATRLFRDPPVASMPASTTFSSEAESAVATVRDPAPPAAAAPTKQQPAVNRIAAPVVAKTKSRARPTTIDRPLPRPRQVTRPLRGPAAPKRCRNLSCL